MFLLLAQGWIERIVLQVHIVIILCSCPAFIPGGESKEETKEKEIHQLWHSKADIKNIFHSFAPPLPSVFTKRFPLSRFRKEYQQLFNVFLAVPSFL